MKRIYSKPLVVVVETTSETFICASEVKTPGRYAVGDDFSTDEIPSTVQDGSDFDHNNGHGAGEGGSGNRAKGSIIFWDDEEDELW